MTASNPIRRALICPNPSTPTEKGYSLKFAAHPKGDKIAYAGGRSVFIRPLSGVEAENRELGAFAFASHVSPVTAISWSPSGYYIASGDSRGVVKIWDVVGEEHRIKTELKAVSGRVNAIAWDAESKRVIAVGFGRHSFGAAFMIDGGSAGEIAGHYKQVNAVAMRPIRPYRAVTAGDDGLVVVYHGAPYRFNTTLKNHKGFVHDVQYTADGAFFFSCGADGQIFQYHGESGEVLSQFGSHKGSVYGLAIHPDAGLASFSADGCIKLWDIRTSKPVAIWEVKDQDGKVQGQIGGVLITNGFLVFGESGQLSQIDATTTATPLRTFFGCQRGVVGAVLTSSGEYCVVDQAGQTLVYNDLSASCNPTLVHGPNLVQVGICTLGEDILTVSLDDSCVIISPSRLERMRVFRLPGQPTDARSDGYTTACIVTATSDVLLVRQTGITSQRKIDSVPKCCAISPNSLAVALENGELCVLDYAMQELHRIKRTSAASVVAFSPDASLLAVGGSDGKIHIYKAVSGELSCTFTGHSARITALGWLDNSIVASGSLDTCIFRWDTNTPFRSKSVKNAHAGQINSICWLDATHLRSAGADGAICDFEFQ